MTGSTIKTDYDEWAGWWSAWFKGQKGDPDAAHGFGPTERAAIINLLDEAEDKMPPGEPAAMNEGEIAVLRWVCAKTRVLSCYSSTDAFLKSLVARGYVTSGPYYAPTDAGRAALKAIEGKQA